MSILTGSKKETRERKKKPDELLSSVVRETATPAAVELLRDNTAFAFPNGTAWVILLLQADAIGGLSKRHSRDEAKGSLIGLIESDQIQTLATSEMLAEEVFGIIPTTASLRRMDEYSLLTNAEYTWAVVYQNETGGLRVDTVSLATFNQAKAISSGVDSLRDAIGDEAWAEHSGEGSPAAEVRAETVGTDTASGPETEAMDVVDDTEGAIDKADNESEADPLFADVPDFDGEDEVPFDEEGSDAPVFDENPEPVADEGVNFDDLMEAGYEEDDDDEEEDDDSEPVADQEAVRDVIARRFLSEDLDLRVGLGEFATTFNIGAPVVQIQVPDGASQWLGDQINQLSRQANAELANLHTVGEADLQTQYVNLMGLHAEQVIKEVDSAREGSVYKALSEGAQAEYTEKQASKEEKIRLAKEEIFQANDEAAKRVAEQAALQAELQYKERNKTRVQREQMEAGVEITTSIEDAYSHTQQEILRLRRKDADHKMAVGQTKIFEVLIEQRAKQVEVETALLEKWTDQIQRIVDENRKSDISRTTALAEEQARFDQVGALTKEHEAAVDRLRNEQSDRLRRLEAEYERSRQAAIEQASVRDEEWKHTLNIEKEKTESQTNRVSDLLGQMDLMSSTFQKQYDERVNEFEAQRDKRIYELEQSNAMQARSGKVLTVLMFASALFTGAAGFIVGALV